MGTHIYSKTDYQVFMDRTKLQGTTAVLHVLQKHSRQDSREYRLKENNFLNNFQIIWKRGNTQKCSLFQKLLPTSWGTNCLHIALHGPLVVLNNATMNKLLVGLTLPEDSGSTL